jgi:hypothetical protein
MGRRMCATAANLIEHVMPEVALRQWVLTFPFAWRKRLAMDGTLLSALTRIFVTSVYALYVKRAAVRGMPHAKTGSLTVLQRTRSDLRLNPHLHVVFLDGAYHQDGGELAWRELGHLQTREVGEVLEQAVRRMARYLERRGALEADDGGAGDASGGQLEASAVSGQVPPAGPQWLRGLRALEPRGLAYDKPLCASLDGFTLHAATRAGALDTAGREALLCYVLRPPVAQERVVPQKDGLIAITLKRAYADGTVAVEMDPLSLLCRLAMSVPPPRCHTVKYAGVLASASPLRSRIAPAPALLPLQVEDGEQPVPRRRTKYRPWAELLKRTFDFDVLSCPSCGGRMKLLALVTDSKGVARYLRALGEPTDVPRRSPSRGPPFWRSTVLRRKALGDVA